jgi:hypothetical protein
MKGTANPSALAEEFDSLVTAWTPPSKTGFEPRSEDPQAA